MKYPDTMRQTILDDLRRLKITDEVIVAAAQASDLDKVVELLEELDTHVEEAAFMVKRIKAWRESLIQRPGATR